MKTHCSKDSPVRRLCRLALGMASLAAVALAADPVKLTSDKPGKVAAPAAKSPATRTLPAQLTVGPNVNISKSAGDNAETGITINPVNPLNMFAISTASNVFRYTTNGGVTWTDSDISGVLGGGSLGDQQMAWDEFGNLFVVYFAGPSFHTVLALSTDGGATLSLLVDTGSLFDQPNVAAGQGEVWFDYTNSGRNAQGAAVTGLGVVGAFSAPQTMPGNPGTFGDLAIGPGGQVLNVYQTQTGNGPSTIFANLNPTGVGGTFGAQITVGTTNVGDFAFITPQPNRSIDAEANLAWDRSGGPHNGRVYLVYTDRPTTSSNDTDIYVRFSDDNGSTWSSSVRVNDDPVGNGKAQFMPKIALDQTTGNIAVSFYDCRNSPGNNTVEFWATVSTDGGASFLANVKVSAGSSVIPPGGFDFGDYSGLAYHAGAFYPCWADNSNSTGDNPAGAGTTTDIYTARVRVDDGIVFVDGTFAGPNPDGAQGFPFPTMAPAVTAARSASTLRIFGVSYPPAISISKNVRLERWNKTGSGIVHIGP